MRLITFIEHGVTKYGQVIGDRVFELPGGDGGLRRYLSGVAAAPIPAPPTGATSWALAEIELLPPIADPAKIICVGLNYSEHIEETGRPQQGFPTIFTRFADTQVGHLSPVIAPLVSEQIDYEGELAVIIGKPGRDISEADALAHVGGYACYNDVSIRDWQKHGAQWTPGKNFPGTGAFGPWLVTADAINNPAQLKIETRLNGETVQSASTRQLVFTIPFLISYISRFTRLGTGDVICTGTPGGVGFTRTPPLFMKNGDVVEVEIEGLGVLRNPVRSVAST